MICPKCHEDKLFLVMGICQDCNSKPVKVPNSPVKAIKGVKVGVRPSRGIEYTQRASTLKLQADCRRYMKSRKWDNLRMAKFLGMRNDDFTKWMDGEYTTSYQPRMNKRVQIALDEYEGVMQGV